MDAAAIAAQRGGAIGLVIGDGGIEQSCAPARRLAESGPVRPGLVSAQGAVENGDDAAILGARVVGMAYVAMAAWRPLSEKHDYRL